jgi:NADH-quinone oxidoreductase subunit C
VSVEQPREYPLGEDVVTDALRARFPDLAARPVDTAPGTTIDAPTLRSHLLYLRDALHFDLLVFMTAIDRPAEGRLEVVYRLFSYQTKASFVVRVLLPRSGARVDTVSDIYRTAEWHERETAEMFGIEFAGHPDPRRLLLPDDLEGHPLRKDFTYPNLRRLPEVG